MNRFVTSLLWLVVLGIAFPAYAVDDRVSFAESPCPFAVPFGLNEGHDVVCGFVTVPQDRTNLDSTPIQIAVAIFKATGENPAPTPLIYLDGGPGGNTLFTIPRYGYNIFVQPHVGNRDVIMFDQRGIGFSQPSLNCPEFETLFYTTIDQPPPENNDLYLATLEVCRQRLLASGIDLSAYNSVENAADVDAIRDALGYAQMDLWGISYGSYLAQYIMRQFPETTRSVILDAVLPVSAEAIELMPTHYERALALLFEGCAADEGCNAAYPNLEAAFYTVVDRLDANPIVVTNVTDSTSGITHDVYVDGTVWLAMFFGQLYSTNVIPLLPQRIYTVFENDNERESMDIFRDILQFLNSPAASSEGMGTSVWCNDIMPFNSPADFEQNVAALTAPQLAAYYAHPTQGTFSNYMQTCAAWLEADEPPEANLPVVSDIPTLIFSGEFDPITPPIWGEAVHASLENSYAYTFVGHGHGVSVTGFCPTNMMQAFLDAPQTAPDASCLTLLANPYWRIPR